MLLRGTLLHQRYQVLQPIGMGGMGTVYKAHDMRLKNTVAVKHLLASTVPEHIEAFRREAQLLARLHHAALPAVHDQFVDDDGHFLVMEYIEGQDFSVMLQHQAGAFDIGLVLSWADQLLDALGYLHSQRPPVIHRDIKPQNLKLAENGQVMLLDFGLAKGSIASLAANVVGHSVYGYTPQYAPIEQVQGTGTDERSDLYSLAATLYHLLAGVPPPSALTRIRARADELPDPLQLIAHYNTQVPGAVDTALRMALALNPDKRPANVAALRSALRSATVLSGIPAVYTPPSDSAHNLELPAQEPMSSQPSLSPGPIVTAPPLKQHGTGEHVTTSTSEPELHRPVTSRMFWQQPLLMSVLLLGVLVVAGFVVLRLSGLTVLPVVSGRRLLTAGVLLYIGFAGMVALYEVVRRRTHTRVLGFHNDSVLSVVFAPNGQLLGSAANDGSVSLWQLGSRPQRITCEGHRGPVRQLCFTPDSRVLISAGDDATVHFWNTNDGSARLVLREHRGPLTSLALTRDGQLLVSGCKAGVLRVWRVRDGRVLYALSEQRSCVQAITIDRAGSKVAAAGEDGNIRVWGLQRGQLLHAFVAHSKPICDLVFSPDGSTLASCAEDTTIQLWRVRDGALLHTLQGHSGPVGGLAFHPDGTILASRSEDGAVKLWRVRDGSMLHTLSANKHYISGIAFVRNGATLVATAWDGSVRLWNVATGKQETRLPGHGKRIFQVAVHPEGESLATGSLDRSVRVWQV